jgi:hypothetical protein
MNPWMMLLVFAVAVLITVMFRGPQPRKTPLPRNENVEPPRRMDEPPVVRPVPLRRRLLPPPLVQAVPKVAPAPTPRVAVAEVKVAATTVSAGKKAAPVSLEMMQLLKNPQSLRAAVLLREVLDAPLCRRRR